MNKFELLSMRPNLQVEDLDRSIGFYREVLGFELAARMDEAGFALMKAGGAELALVVRTNPQPGGAYLYVTGVEALLARCQAASVSIVAPLTVQPWGLHDFVVQDPDGHRIAVGERL